MTAYYNEFDPFAAERLRILITRGLIAPGYVDTRSITEVKPDDLRGYTQCHFFAGIGGWSLGARMAGWPDDRPLWTGSCPCQPFSTASADRKGIQDERHLWPTFFQLIRECQPPVVAGEQVSSAIGEGWLCELISDMQSEDYDTAAIVFEGSLVGADHARERLYWISHTGSEGRERSFEPRQTFPVTNEPQFTVLGEHFAFARRTSPEHQRSVLQRDGVSLVMERNLIKTYGNAIIPQAAAMFLRAYMEL